MSVSMEIPNMVISGKQLWLWAHKPHPTAVQTICLWKAANHSEVGLKGANETQYMKAKLLQYSPRISSWKKTGKVCCKIKLQEICLFFIFIFFFHPHLVICSTKLFCHPVHIPDISPEPCGSHMCLFTTSPNSWICRHITWVHYARCMISTPAWLRLGLFAPWQAKAFFPEIIPACLDLSVWGWASTSEPVSRLE